MFLHRIHLDPRCREARRDLSDPYQFHSTVCRAFCAPDKKCPDGEILWRLEPETDGAGCPRILVQSRTMADWTSIGVQGWLANADQPIDLKTRLKLGSLKAGQLFRFRLRANPSVTRNGKRLGLLQGDEQERWLERKGEQHGFSLPQSSRGRIDVGISQDQMLRGNQRSNNAIRIFSVLYDGMLEVREPDDFRNALQSGIGHGKVMGLGLLSVATFG